MASMWGRGSSRVRGSIGVRLAPGLARARARAKAASPCVLDGDPGSPVGRWHLWTSRALVVALGLAISGVSDDCQMMLAGCRMDVRLVWWHWDWGRPVLARGRGLT